MSSPPTDQPRFAALDVLRGMAILGTLATNIWIFTNPEGLVGYVNDSDISSKLRIRFDAGYGVAAADRAEFFYGKCGCYRGLPVTNPAYDPNAAGPGPGVADPHGGAELPAGGYLRVGDPQLVDVEVGVGAAVAEREERGRVDAGDAGTLRSTQRRLQVGARLPARTARDLHR